MSADQANALETVDVTKLFGAVRAVDQLSISIPRKGMTSIVGPNGSGKSTLINLLSGTLPLDGGMVIIDGVGLRIVKPHETPQHGLTRTFQEVRLFDQITVWDNIMVVLTNRRLFPAMIERAKPAYRVKAQQILENVGMWDKRTSLARDLSYGQRKLLEIGRALALDVNTYLLLCIVARAVVTVMLFKRWLTGMSRSARRVHVGWVEDDAINGCVPVWKLLTVNPVLYYVGRQKGIAV